MYEELFELKRRPFRANAVGADVFVGPQTARTMQALKKGFATSDGIVLITGPAGVGKTTLVRRSVSSRGGAILIHLGRMQLRHDEVLDYILEELNIDRLPPSTIKKISLFRAILVRCAEIGKRLFIVVEDANRIGEDALVELEALTAAGNGQGDGANMILMGNDQLWDELSHPDLARVKQRVRLRHRVDPLSPAELQGYLKHCFRLSGGEFDLVFAEGSASLIAGFSDGVPNVANNLVNSILAAAADQGLKRIDAELIARVADEEYGLTVETEALDVAKGSPKAAAAPPLEPMPTALTPSPSLSETHPELPKLDFSVTKPDAAALDDTAPPPAKAPAAATTKPEPSFDASTASVAPAAIVEKAAPPIGELPTTQPSPAARRFEAANDASPAPATAEPSLPRLKVAPAVAPRPAPVDNATTADQDDYNVPDLIQDTLPDLEVLAPELAAAAMSIANDVDDMDDDNIPVLQSSQRLEIDRLPTAEPAEPVAAAAPTPPPVAPDTAAPAAPANAATPAKPDEETPAWDRDPTLAELRPDIEALEAAMADAAAQSNEDVPEPDEEEDVEIELKDPTLPGVPEITLDSAIRDRVDKAQASLAEQPAANADDAGEPARESQAPSPRDTKADAELEKIAAELAKAKTIEDVNDKMAETLFGEQISLIAAQVVANQPEAAQSEVAPGTLAGADAPPAAPVTPAAEQTAMEREFKEVYGENALEVSLESKAPGGMDLSASQRLATVRALNADAIPAAAFPPTPAPPAPRPAPIEDQIDTSITETIKTLKVKQVDAQNDDGEESKSGFFSRFRRS